MIRLKGVVKRFSGRPVLNDISFETGEGEILFILGRSGTGKSVLLKNIVGLLRPDAGEIFIDDSPVHQLDEAQLFTVRRQCGMVFQQPALLDSLTVYENLAFGLRAHRLARGPAIERGLILEALNLVNVFEEQARELFHRYPSELSLGLQKRLSIARSLVLRPRYLLFDEPTTGFDPLATKSINELLVHLQKTTKVTTLVVSHDMESAIEVADRILFLEEGRLVESGTPQALLRSEVPIVREFLKEVRR